MKTEFPRRKREAPLIDGIEGDGFAAELGDVLVGHSKPRKLPDPLNALISWLHGYFTHCAVVIEVDDHGLPARVSHAYGSGLITQSYTAFEKSYDVIAVARLGDNFAGEAAAKKAEENTVDRDTINLRARIKSGRFRESASPEKSPETDAFGDGYGFSGYDLGLAGVICARARLRDIKSFQSDTSIEWEEAGFEIINEGDFRFTKDPRDRESRKRKRFTCAGRVYQIFLDAYKDKSVIEPAFLEHVYRAGDWVFDEPGQTMSYRGPSTFALDDSDDGIGDVNLLDAAERKGGFDERGWHVDFDNPDQKTLLDKYVDKTSDPSRVKGLPDKALTVIETTAVSWGTLHGARAIGTTAAFRVQSVVGPCDLWESPSFEKRGFLKGADKYRDYCEKVTSQ